MLLSLAAASFFAVSAAHACPGCKNAIGGDGAGGDHTVNNTGVGYALSIGFMILTPFSLIGVGGVMAYRNCQTLAAQHRRRDEEENGVGGDRQGPDAS